MAQTIKLRRSATSGAIPTTSQIELGELALNTYDGKVYMKKSVNGTESIVEVTSSTSSGGTGVFYTDEFSGDGNTAGFTLSVAPVSEDDLIVFIDGVYQNLNSYSISGTTLTFDTAPDNGTTVIVHHVQGGILGTAPAIDTMTGDGSDTTLTLSVAPSSENQTFVTFDGVVQHKSTYSISGTTLTFSEAVPNGVAVECITFRNVQVATFEDADGDTKIQVEETADEDIIRFDVAGTEVVTMTSDGIVGSIDGAIQTPIRNTTGSTIYKGQAVYVTGLSGDTPTVALARANSASTMPAVGIARADILNNTTGQMTVLGTLPGIDTTGSTNIESGVTLSVNDVLYVSATQAGHITNVPPTSESNLIQNLGRVVRVFPTTNMTFSIQGAGRTNAVPNLDDGDIFIGNASNQPVTASLDTEIESYLDGGTSTPTFASAIVSGDLTVDTNRLYVDSTNDRVGIALSTPPHRFSVGSANDDGIALYNGTNDLATIFRENNEQARFSLLDTGTVKVRLSSKPSDVNYINNGGNVGIGTDSPTAPLDLRGSVGGGGIARIIDSTTESSIAYKINGATSGTVGWVAGNASDDFFFYSYTLGSQAMTLKPTGRVGIGETNPAYRLDVNSGSTDEVARFQTTANARIKITSSNTANAIIDFGDSDSSTIGQIDYDNLDNSMRFVTNGSERMRIDGSGRFAMGNTPSISTNYILSIDSDASGQAAGIHFTHGTKNLYLGYNSTTATDNAEMWNAANGYLRFGTNNQERMTILAGGNVGIGTSNPGFSLDIRGTYGTSTAGLCIHNNSSAAIGNVSLISFNTNNTFNGTDVQDITIGAVKTNAGNRESAFVVNTCVGTGSPVERIRITHSGILTVKSNTVGQGGGAIALQPQDASTADAQDYGFISFRNNSETTLAQIKGISEGSGNNKSHIEFYTSDGSLGHRMRIRDNGTVQVIGALSKGSGSFEIEHPLESKRETHLLRHSFIEGPQCDNIYRGTVTLTDGSATVNLDSVSNMTSGTFVALNTDVQVFTTNETDWDAVKGSVSGNILTITCQNSSSTATVSWLVIAERQDDNIISSTITDEYGKLIVEPEVYEGGT